MEINLICSDPSQEKPSRQYPGLAKAFGIGQTLRGDGYNSQTGGMHFVMKSETSTHPGDRVTVPAGTPALAQSAQGAHCCDQHPNHEGWQHSFASHFYTEL